MTHGFSIVLFAVTFGATLASILYLAFATCKVTFYENHHHRKHYPQPGSPNLSPVTVLKPICGPDPNLYENLRSFCQQAYPHYQVLFGVSDAADPAITIIERVIADFPNLDLGLVMDDRLIGTNFKVSSLANMLGLAKYDILVIADSDMRVQPDYLGSIVAPFEDPDVGAVTCLYKGCPVGGLASAIAAMFINEWFLPSVLVALIFEKLRYCFGASMAVRREALEAIGGFEALADDLADDYMLGKLLSERGYKIHLAPYLVENVVLEPDLKRLFLHELRWARTVRSVRPVGYAFSFVAYPLPMSILFLLVTRFATLGVVAVALTLGLRVLLHYAVRAAFRLSSPAMPWLIPIRDILAFLIWCVAFLGRRVQWRNGKFSLSPDGRLTVVEGRLNLS
ncbi:MAG: bacteriohopanetetrol glucosamine biosynthesis glycosyltransferase HpnI [Candidatus Methylomirabilota bacterium]|jgi:ceramide glucosyltransferase